VPPRPSLKGWHRTIYAGRAHGYHYILGKDLPENSAFKEAYWP
jgi:hypothetical protein